MIPIFAIPVEAKEPDPIMTPPTPKEYLREKAGNHFGLANAIVIAESGWNPEAKNPKSSASGLFQFIDGTFKHYCIDEYGLTDSIIHKNDPYVQIDCAIMMLDSGLENHWNASSSSWKKSVKNAADVLSRSTQETKTNTAQENATTLPR